MHAFRHVPLSDCGNNGLLWFMDPAEVLHIDYMDSGKQMFSLGLTVGGSVEQFRTHPLR